MADTIVRYNGKSIEVTLPHPNLAVPKGWNWLPYAHLVNPICSRWPKAKFVVSSITHTLDGEARSLDPTSPFFGPSHVRGVAIDLAPVTSLIDPYGERRNPRLGDSLDVGLSLAAISESVPGIFAAEGNHFHLELSPHHYVFMVPTYSSFYVNDKRDSASGRPKWRAMIVPHDPSIKILSINDFSNLYNSL